MKILRLTMLMLFLVSFSINANKLLSQDTARAERYLKSGITLFNNNDFRKAVTNFNNSIREVPTAFAYFMMGAACFNMGNYAEAKSAANSSLNFRPPLTINRQKDARNVKKAADSMLHLPVVVVEEISGVASSPITSLPKIKVKNPKDNENPLTAPTLLFGPKIISAPLLASQQNIIVKSSYYCDLENTGQAKAGDFWWNVSNLNTAAIVPLSSVRVYLVGNCPACYDNATLSQLKEDEAKGLFTSNSISKQYLNPGTLIAYITRNNFYGIMKVENLVYGRSVDLAISYKTFAN